MEIHELSRSILIKEVGGGQCGRSTMQILSVQPRLFISVHAWRGWLGMSHRDNVGSEGMEATN